MNMITQLMVAVARCPAWSSAALVVLGLTASVLGQSRITYSLELGGDNHASAWKTGTRPLYTRGSPAAGQGYYYGYLVNYAVVLKTEGVQLTGNGAGHETFGAANVVFNLELHQGGATGPLATGAIFQSTINDGNNGDPVAAAAFAVSYALGSSRGRLIDTFTNGGPRMQPFFTYPYFAPNSGRLIGMGAGYREWNRTGSNDVFTQAGVGMVNMPNGAGGYTPGLGVVPIAEGQIDMSALPISTYTLLVVPDANQNVLRGDLNLLAATNRPAFATAAEQSVGGAITFVSTPPCNCDPGIHGRYLFYNNCAWDGNTPAITMGDFNAIAPDKIPLLPGQSATPANYSTYYRSINGIIVDAYRFNRLPVPDFDVYFAYGASGDPYGWSDVVYPNQMQLFPGAGVNGSDRLVITFPDNAVPNSRWLLCALFAGDGTLGIPEDDYFMFGIQKCEGTGDRLVNATDEVAARNNPHGLMYPAPITDPHDCNRDKFVNATDEVLARNNPAGVLTAIKLITW